MHIWGTALHLLTVTDLLIDLHSSQMTGIHIKATFAFNWLLNTLSINFFGNFEIFTWKTTLIDA